MIDMVRTVESKEVIKVGMTVRFGELFDGNTGDGEELLADRCVSPDNENVVAFEIVEEDEEWWDTLVKVTDIY